MACPGNYTLSEGIMSGSITQSEGLTDQSILESALGLILLNEADVPGFVAVLGGPSLDPPGR